VLDVVEGSMFVCDVVTVVDICSLVEDETKISLLVEDRLVDSTLLCEEVVDDENPSEVLDVIEGSMIVCNVVKVVDVASEVLEIASLVVVDRLETSMITCIELVIVNCAVEDKEVSLTVLSTTMLVIDRLVDSVVVCDIVKGDVSTWIALGEEVLSLVVARNSLMVPDTVEVSKLTCVMLVDNDFVVENDSSIVIEDERTSIVVLVISVLI